MEQWAKELKVQDRQPLEVWIISKPLAAFRQVMADRTNQVH